MNLKVLLPFQVFVEKTGVSRIVVETPSGFYGFLPQRLDCVTAIEPGILTYQVGSEGEIYLAVDEGILVKTGAEVLVSVRRAVAGTDLGQLGNTVEQEFLTIDEQERAARAATARLESGFLRRFVTLQHG